MIVVIILPAAALFDCLDICSCMKCFRFETMEKSDPTDNDKGKRKNKQTKEDMKAEKKDKYQKAVEALKSAQFPNPVLVPSTSKFVLRLSEIWLRMAGIILEEAERL